MRPNSRSAHPELVPSDSALSASRIPGRTSTGARAGVACAAVLACAFASHPAWGVPPFSIVDTIPALFSNDVAHQRETNIAVNRNAPANRRVVISAFGALVNAGNIPANTHPYLLSRDNGVGWENFSPAPGVFPDNINHGDTTVAFTLDPNLGGFGTLYATRLYQDGAGKNNIQLLKDTGAGLSTGGVPNAIPGSNLGPAPVPNPGGLPDFNPDQPWVSMGFGLDPGSSVVTDRAYIGLNNFSATLANAPKAQLQISPDVSLPAPNFSVITLDPTANPNGNAVRTAVSGETVYVAYQRYTGAQPAVNRGLPGDVIVRRDDTGGVQNNPFRALNNQNGRNVVTNKELTANLRDNAGNLVGPFLGGERLGSDIAIAVSKLNQQKVYVAYAEVTAANTTLLHVLRSVDKGETWQETFFTPKGTSSALPSLAVLDNGAVGLLYYALNANNRFEARFMASADGLFSNFDDDTILAEFPSNVGLPHPLIGDYFEVEALGNTFYGSFVAPNDNRDAVTLGYSAFPSGVTFLRDMLNGRPANGGANIATSLDPFFFRTDIVPEPSAGMLAPVAAWLIARRRRR